MLQIRDFELLSENIEVWSVHDGAFDVFNEVPVVHKHLKYLHFYSKHFVFEKRVSNSRYL